MNVRKISKAGFRSGALSASTLSLLMLCAAGGVEAGAANGPDTWTGAFNSFLSAADWSGTNTPPTSGDSLAFGAAGAGGLLLNNNLTSGSFNVAGITFNAGAAAFVIGDGTTTANAGNAFVLTGGITNNSTSLETINDPFSLAATQTFTTTSGGGNLALSGNISGAGGITTAGGGTLILSGANTFTGGTTITAGTLQLGTGGSTGSITGNVTDNGTLVFNRSDDFTFGGVVSGSGGVILNGNILRFSAAQTYTGPTQITAGILVLATTVDQGLSASSVVTVATGASLDLSSRAQTVAGLVGGGTVYSFNTSAGSLTLGVAAGQTYNFSGTLGGSFPNFAFAKSGSGTQILSGSNTYTGETNISAGTLQMGNNGTSGSLSPSSAITDNGTLAFNRTNTVTQGTDFASVIGGSGSVIQQGSGTLVLNGANTYIGGTTIYAGTLQLGAGGTTGSVIGDITDNGTLVFYRSDDFTFGGVISGSGGLVNNGYYLRLSKAQTYTGPTQINTSVLVLPTTVDQGLSAFSVVTIATGANLDISNRAQTVAGLEGAGAVYSFIPPSTPTTGSLNLNVAAGQSHTFSGTMGGILPNFAFAKSGPGTQILSGANTYTGGTTINAGTLQLGASGSTGSITGNVTDNGTLVFNRSDDFTFGGMISGSGGLVQNGSILRLTAAQTYTGPTQINSGFLVLPTTVDQGLSASSLVTVATGATLDIAGHIQTVAGIAGGGTVYSVNSSAGSLTVGVAAGQTYHFSGTLGGSATNFAFAKSGAGTQILSGANTYTGATTISAGTLQLGDGENTGSILPGSAITDNGTLAFNRANTVTQGTDFAGVIGGSGSVIQQGSGTLLLNGTNTYTGATTISAGTLQLGNNGTTGSLSPSSAVIDNGILVFNRTNTVIQGTDFASVIDGSGSLIQQGSGTLILNGTNTYTGATTISAGTLSLTGTLASGTAISTSGAGILSQTSTGAISGASSLTLGGTGTSILAGANSYTGATVVNAGTLQLGNNGTSGSLSPSSSITDNGVLAFNRTDTVIQAIDFAGVIGGSGSLIQQGSGTLVLNGANTYTGPTVVNAGTLQLGNNGTSGSLSPSSSITDNGILAFNRTNTVLQGTDFASVIGGIGSVIQQGSGTLVLTGVNTFTGGTTVNGGTLQLGDGVHTASLQGAAGAGFVNFPVGGTGGPGGKAVTLNNDSMLNLLANATITAGAGGPGYSGVGSSGYGGTGGNSVVFNSDGFLANNGTIKGGDGGNGGFGRQDNVPPYEIFNGGFGGNGGNAVVLSAGGSLTNNGTISAGTGGNGGSGGSGGNGGNGGNGVAFSLGGSLANTGTITGGPGGNGGPGVAGSGVNGSSGSPGIGVSFAGAAGTLSNQTGGIINGGVSMGNFANSVTLETGSKINGALNIGSHIGSTLTLTGSGSQLYSGAVTGTTTFAGSLTKSGSGTWILDQPLSYAGPTVVAGGTLVVNTSITASSSVSVSIGGKLSGHGSVSAMSGAGLVAPGGSQILTGTNVDPGSGLNFSFILTQPGAPTYGNASTSGNDLLHLTDATPFVLSLTAANTVTLDFSEATLLTGQTYLGGFFTDAAVANSLLSNVTFVYLGLNGGAVQYDGLVTQATADFATGTVSNGEVMEFEIISVPEPGSASLALLGCLGLLPGRRKRRAALE